MKIKAPRSTLIRGVRIHLGQNGHEVVPPSVSFGSRTFTFAEINRAKWVDVIFTAQETLDFAGSVELNFAPSQHHDQRVIVEALKVFGQSRTQVEKEAAENEKRANKCVLRTGPRSSSDIMDSAIVECYAQCANLIIKGRVSVAQSVKKCSLWTRF